jgi:two-component system, cell cycle response regulator
VTDSIQPPAGLPANAMSADGPPRILLAEDDAVTRMLLTHQLTRAGYEVDAVTDGLAALAQFGKRFYPLLISDWEMPGLDGVSLCRKVRAMKLEGYVYALLLTAKDAKENLIAGLEAGADDYLVKPVLEAELMARLNTGRRILALEQSLRTANEQNRHLSITDSLTGTFNRRYMMEQLPRELDRCRRYERSMTVALCDVDHFKQVNDTYGHGVGDEVLLMFAERLRHHTRSASDWIARYGGEEFVIVFPETSFGGGMHAAEKIRAAIAGSSFKTSAGEIEMTISMGVGSVRCDSMTPHTGVDALIRFADECLYESKEAGRNRVTGREMPCAENPAAALIRHGATDR